MATPNTQLQTLTTNNTISQMMLKINELVYELNMFFGGSFDYILPDGIVSDTNINASANISDLKLATISTAGKVLNSATSANTSNFPSTVILRDGLGSFSANVVSASSLVVGSNMLVTNLNADYLDGFSSEYFASNSNLLLHTSNVSNPHIVTATQVGLGSVTNESKEIMFTAPTFTGNTGSPAITIIQTGTGNAISSNGFIVTANGDLTIKDSKINTELVIVDDTANNLIYSYNINTYRTVELLAQVTDITNLEYQSTKLLLIHNAGNVYKVEYGTIYTVDELGTFYSDLTATNVEVYFSANDISNKEIKIFATMLIS